MPFLIKRLLYVSMKLDPEVEANVLTRRSTWRSRRSSYRVSISSALPTDSSPRPGLTERAANVVGVCKLVKKSDKQVAAVRRNHHTQEATARCQL